ncbi:hypothetical protein VOLCADRAFT_93924 [Volvox carteri f. nagariensis]|uniref:Uncharacterized protein n=1 Tax=Volvox carteri f. nagariensis TaxID=3068 RepID=D8U3F6_VOLCA|nr:uncharacterized protein VOLCADRAFT_93924 [Volvox carteri f. nagariensis]EFJ45816.1 hypothetical protein VOLCADRAFT_93924 [Volvox carteri f. nagariensis]|eukprot:XP_002953217.1 hypothetical protein VOLCADRAFT_93924 [Volvox carteri f. nagariensis]
MTAARERISNSAAASREPSSKSLLAAPLPPGGGSRPLSRAPAAAAAAASSSDDQHTRAVLVRASTRLLASGLVAAASFRRQGTTEAPAADPLEFNNVPIWEDRLRSSTRARTPRWGAALASSSGGGRRLAAVAAAARAAAAAAAAAAAVSAADPDDGARDIVMADAFGSGRKARMADVADEVQQLDAAAGWIEPDVARALPTWQGRALRTVNPLPVMLVVFQEGVGRARRASRSLPLLAAAAAGAVAAAAASAMTMILSGPSLEQPLSRLLTHTLVLLAAMLATHVICYIVLMGLINSQYAHVHEIHRVALASDRTQVPLTSHLLDLMEALNDLESYHHNVYLGTDVASAGGKSRGQTPRKIDQGGLYDMWTKSALPYQVYMDLESPSWVNLTAGVWQLGNRFVATCRELLYWGQRLGGNISHIRSFQFVQANGPWSLFQAYTASLDYLARMAWEDVAALQHSLLIILLVEAIAIQLSCIVYEWWLVRKVEMRRRGALLVPLGLPGPVLRLLSNRPLVVMEDSDDEAESEEGAAGHAGDGDGMGPYRRSLDGNADGAIAADAASTATTQGHIRRFADGGGAVHRTHHRASIDFAPLRSGAYLGTASGGGGKVSLERHLRLTEAADAASQHHHYGRMSVEVLGPHGSGGGGAATGAVAESPTAAAAPVRQAPEVTVDPRNAEVAAHLEQTPLLKDRTDEVGSERAAPVRQCVMVLGGAGGGGSVSSITVAAASDGVSGGGGPGRRNAVAVISESHGSQLAVNGKHLTANSRNMLRFLVPLLLWEVALATIGGLSYYWLEGMQAGSVFQKAVPASTFESSSFAGNFFTEERCFRWDQSKCYTPDSPYYQLTHHGLDSMMRRVVSELELLVADDDADAVYNGTRYMVGTKDLYEGLQSSAQLFVDFMIGRYQNVKLLHTLLLVATIVLFVTYALLVLRPYLAGVAQEAHRLAGLLSHVPADMDVATYARNVMRAAARAMQANGGGGGGGGSAAATAAATAAGDGGTAPPPPPPPGSTIGGRVAAVKGQAAAAAEAWPCKAPKVPGCLEAIIFFNSATSLFLHFPLPAASTSALLIQSVGELEPIRGPVFVHTARYHRADTRCPPERSQQPQDNPHSKQQS